MKKIIVLLLSLTVLSLMLSAQNTKQRERFKEKMKEKKIAFVNERINFTEAEAKAFWPKYDSYMEKKHALRNELRQNRREIKKGESDKYEQFNDLFVQLQVEDAALLKDYYQDLKKILPAKKIYLLHEAEKDFKKQLLDKVGRRRE